MCLLCYSKDKKDGNKLVLKVCYFFEGFFFILLIFGSLYDDEVGSRGGKDDI